MEAIVVDQAFSGGYSRAFACGPVERVRCTKDEQQFASG
jgi:hypothetical protein